MAMDPEQLLGMAVLLRELLSFVSRSSIAHLPEDQSEGMFSGGMRGSGGPGDLGLRGPRGETLTTRPVVVGGAHRPSPADRGPAGRSMMSSGKGDRPRLGAVWCCRCWSGGVRGWLSFCGERRPGRGSNRPLVEWVGDGVRA